MSEYGHFGTVIPGIGCLDSWGAGPFIILDGAREWRFTFSERFGPLLEDKHGMVLTRQPISARDPFWVSFNAWNAQGRRTTDDKKFAIWDRPLATKVKHVYGRQYVIVEEGDELGPVVVVGGKHEGVEDSARQIK